MWSHSLCFDGWISSIWWGRPSNLVQKGKLIQLAGIKWIGYGFVKFCIVVNWQIPPNICTCAYIYSLAIKFSNAPILIRRCTVYLKEKNFKFLHAHAHPFASQSFLHLNIYFPPFLYWLFWILRYWWHHIWSIQFEYAFPCFCCYYICMHRAASCKNILY